MEEPIATSAPVPTVSETLHEAHPHAHRRVIVGIVAILLVFVLGGIVWMFWGDRIERACLGISGGCPIPEEEGGSTTFTTSEDYSF